MRMHPYYTEVHRRSFDAIVKNGWLSEILMALIADPDNSMDLADVLRRNGKDQSLSIDLQRRGERPHPAPISVSEFADRGTWAVDRWRITLAQWAMSFKEARPALHSLTLYDRRLGVWCACQVAREALRYTPDVGNSARVSIETTEAWVMGQATIAQVKSATDDAVYAGWSAGIDSADASAAYISDDAAYAATVDDDLSAANIASHTADAANTAWRTANANNAEVDADSGAELIRLREVVANACMTFPL